MRCLSLGHDDCNYRAPISGSDSSVLLCTNCVPYTCFVDVTNSQYQFRNFSVSLRHLYATELGDLTVSDDALNPVCLQMSQQVKERYGVCWTDMLDISPLEPLRVAQENLCLFISSP